MFLFTLTLSLSACASIKLLQDVGSIGQAALTKAFAKKTQQDPSIDEIIQQEKNKMREEAQKNELAAKKESEIAVKTEREEMRADIDSITDLLVNAGFDQMPAEKIFKKGEEFYVKALGVDKRKNVFAIRLILPAEPDEIQSKWWTPANKNGFELEDGLYFLNKRKINEKTFSFIFLADLKKIKFDQFVVILRYTHPVSGIKYSHQIPFDKPTINKMQNSQK